MPKAKRIIHSVIYAVEDTQRVDICRQRDRLVHSRDRIGRRLMRAAKRKDMLKVLDYSRLMTETQARLEILNNRVLDMERGR